MTEMTSVGLTAFYARLEVPLEEADKSCCNQPQRDAGEDQQQGLSQRFAQCGAYSNRHDIRG